MTLAGLKPWRALAVVVLGCGLGLAWNAVSGRGLALGQNAFVQPGDVEVEVAEARQRLDRGALFLDAREVDWYELGHVPGALPLPEGQFEKHFPALEPRLRERPDLDVIVYCSGFGCEASHNVARELKKRGIPAAVLQGGWPSWEAAGYPINKGAEP
jgi:rhodanese-related sulfurtransferase